MAYQILLYTKLISTLLIFSCVLLNMLFFEQIKWLLQKTDCVTTFSSGIFLGAALIHLLPDSVGKFVERDFWLPLPFIIVGAIFILLTTTEQLVNRKKLQPLRAMEGRRPRPVVLGRRRFLADRNGGAPLGA